MLSSSTILEKLTQSPATHAALLTPAVVTGLETLGNTHTVVNSYAPDMAEDIPLGTQAGVLRKIALIFLPIFLAFGWVAFFKSVSDLARVRRSPDKKIPAELGLNIMVNFLAAAGATLATVFLFAGLAYLAPYIITAVLGVNALYGLYNTVKELYFAYKDPALRRHHLKEAGKQILGIVINTLSIVLNIFIFQTAKLVAKGIHDFASDILSIFLHFQELMDLIHGPVMAGAAVIKMAGIGWLASFSVWLVISASKLNHQTYCKFSGKPTNEPTYEDEVVRDLRFIVGIIKDSQQPIAKRLFFLITAPTVLFPLYGLTSLIHAVVIRPVAALLVGIPELLLRGMYSCVKRCCDSSESGTQYQEMMLSGEARKQDSPLTPISGQDFPPQELFVEVPEDKNKDKALVKSKKGNLYTLYPTPPQDSVTVVTTEVEVLEPPRRGCCPFSTS